MCLKSFTYFHSFLSFSLFFVVFYRLSIHQAALFEVWSDIKIGHLSFVELEYWFTLIWDTNILYWIKSHWFIHPMNEIHVIIFVNLTKYDSNPYIFCILGKITCKESMKIIFMSRNSMIFLSISLNKTATIFVLYMCRG